ncbi:hypothetical protein PR048_022845 [Dryococelus australis]|uniref:Uncharacterized protein n=1 Tax=Dryococelus australis TaxID=614101 RepID=A0ABQ9GSF2_9NEOP|nr:hypothetical protein PR048_022845 [Dryococelus australis]
MKGRCKREIPEKTHRSVASSGTLNTRENPGGGGDLAGNRTRLVRPGAPARSRSGDYGNKVRFMEKTRAPPLLSSRRYNIPSSHPAGTGANRVRGAPVKTHGRSDATASFRMVRPDRRVLIPAAQFPLYAFQRRTAFTCRHIETTWAGFELGCFENYLPPRPTNAHRVRFPVGFLGDLPFPPPLQSGIAPRFTSLRLSSSQDLDVEGRPNLFTQSRYLHVAEEWSESRTSTGLSVKLEFAVHGLAHFTVDDLYLDYSLRSGRAGSLLEDDPKEHNYTGEGNIRRNEVPNHCVILVIFRARGLVSPESLKDARYRWRDCMPVQCFARRGDERVDAHVSVAHSAPTLLSIRRAKFFQTGDHLNRQTDWHVRNANNDFTEIISVRGGLKLYCSTLFRFFADCKSKALEGVNECVASKILRERREKHRVRTGQELRANQVAIDIFLERAEGSHRGPWRPLFPKSGPNEVRLAAEEAAPPGKIGGPDVAAPSLICPRAAGEAATHINCAIAAPNWRAVFSSQCAYTLFAVKATASRRHEDVLARGLQTLKPAARTRHYADNSSNAAELTAWRQPLVEGRFTFDSLRSSLRRHVQAVTDLENH